MKNKFRIINILLISILFLAACNLPSGQQSAEGDFALTAAAQTVEALLTGTPANSNVTGSPTFTPITGSAITSTLTPTATVSTNTPIATATSNCNLAQFVTDVTIPDNTIMTPNQAFTKTWRFKNVGTCTWTPSYSVVFFNGNAMNGPATQALVGNVNPGQTVDISVNLTAPGSQGDYTGNWKLRDASGVLFNQFYVQIKVQNPVTATFTPPALPPAIAQIILTNLAGEGGQVRSDGTVIAGTPNTGDTDANGVIEAFASFDMTGIPNGANITKVVVDFGGGHDLLGAPWALSDGCLRAYPQNYGALDAGDFVPGDPLGAVIQWCGEPVLNSTFEGSADLKNAVQNRVGSSRFQLRIQFRAPTTNSNGIADVIRLGTMKLTVTYQ